PFRDAHAYPLSAQRRVLRRARRARARPSPDVQDRRCGSCRDRKDNAEVIVIVNAPSSPRVALARPRAGRAAMTGFVCLFVVVLVLLAGCGPKHVIATARIPQP